MNNTIDPTSIIALSTSTVLFYIKVLADDLFNDMEIEDIVSDVETKVLSSEYDPSLGKPSTWIAKIAFNTVYTAVGRKRRELSLFVNAESIDEINDKDEETSYHFYTNLADGRDAEADYDLCEDEVADALLGCTFTERDKDILELKYLGYTPKEIAEKLHITSSTVNMAIHHIKTRFYSRTA